MKHNIEKIIKDEFKKLGKRKNKKLLITTDNVTDSYYVKYESKYVSIDIDLLLYKNQFNWACVWIDESLREKGLGRKIVKIGENIAKKTRIEHLYILGNTNPNFWEHMGYKNDYKPLPNKYSIKKEDDFIID